PIPSGRSVQGAFWEREGASGVPKGALQHRIGRGDGRHQHAVSANGWVAAAAPCAGNSQNLPAPMKKSGIIWGVVAVLLVGGAAALLAIAWRPALAAVDPAAKQAFDPALVKRGREPAAIGSCNSCHTVRGGKNFAGGLPVPTPFGVVFSSNITPDPET